MIVVGIISLVAIVTLRQGAIGAPAGDGASLIMTGKALVALHNATFLFGPGFAIGINTTLLASLMYRSQLVPGTIARIGLIAGSVIFASSIAVLFGAYERTSAVATVAAFPVFAWEMSLAGWMIVKGFEPRQAVDRASRPIALGSRVETAPSY
jgi:hypothetical protein